MPVGRKVEATKEPKFMRAGRKFAHKLNVNNNYMRQRVEDFNTGISTKAYLVQICASAHCLSMSIHYLNIF